MSTLILVLAALLPAVVLCVYVFMKDRVEKEPVGLLLKLLLFGAISCFPAAYIEIILSDGIDLLFAGHVRTSSDTIIYSGPFAYFLYPAVKNFFGVALVEEGLKLLILLKVVHKNKEFNSLFDGIIYSVFVSLGFAALENVFYVFEHGFSIAVMRAILSVPGHMFFAVMMGYQYSLWHVKEKAIAEERMLKSQGLIDSGSTEFCATKNMVMCLLIPVFAHGFYNFCCSFGQIWSTLLLIAFVIFMYVHCFGKIRKMSKTDGYEKDYVRHMIQSKYPHIETWWTADIQEETYGD